MEPIFDFVSRLPLDMTRIIFFKAKANLPAIALVSKVWKERAYDGQLYKNILSSLPVQPFGREAWIKHLGDPGHEILLPLCVGRDVNNGFLTLIPESIGGDVPINPKSMGSLVTNPKEGHKTDYSPLAWKTAIDNSWPLEKMHWVWIRHEPLGTNLTLQEQQHLAHAKGASLVNFSDYVVTAFMEKIRSGRLIAHCMCVKDIVLEQRICMHFNSEGLYVTPFTKGYHDLTFSYALRFFGR